MPFPTLFPSLTVIALLSPPRPLSLLSSPTLAHSLIPLFSLPCSRSRSLSSPPPHLSLLSIALSLSREQTGAVINFGGYYVVALPLAVGLGFGAALGIVGLWVGLVAGVLLQVWDLH